MVQDVGIVTVEHYKQLHDESNVDIVSDWVGMVDIVSFDNS